VGFANPGALLMGKNDGDGVGGFLERMDQRMDVGRGLSVGLVLSNSNEGEKRGCVSGGLEAEG